MVNVIFEIFVDETVIFYLILSFPAVPDGEEDAMVLQHILRPGARPPGL